MLITIIIFAMSLLLLVGYSFKGIAIAKKKLAIDAKLYELLTAKNAENPEEVGKTTAKENSDPEIEDKVTESVDGNALAEVYNEVAVLDNEYVEYSSNLPKLAVITAIIGIITVIAYFILETPV